MSSECHMRANVNACSSSFTHLSSIPEDAIWMPKNTNDYTVHIRKPIDTWSNLENTLTSLEQRNPFGRCKEIDECRDRYSSLYFITNLDFCSKKLTDRVHLLEKRIEKLEKKTRCYLNLIPGVAFVTTLYLIDQLFKHYSHFR